MEGKLGNFAVLRVGFVIGHKCWGVDAIWEEGLGPGEAFKTWGVNLLVSETGGSVIIKQLNSGAWDAILLLGGVFKEWLGLGFALTPLPLAARVSSSSPGAAAMAAPACSMLRCCPPSSLSWLPVLPSLV